MTTKLSTKQAADHLGLSPWTLLKWRKLGRGPAFIRLGSRVRYDCAALDEYLVAHTVGPDA